MTLRPDSGEPLATPQQDFNNILVHLDLDTMRGVADEIRRVSTALNRSRAEESAPPPNEMAKFVADLEASGLPDRKRALDWLKDIAEVTDRVSPSLASEDDQAITEAIVGLTHIFAAFPPSAPPPESGMLEEFAGHTEGPWSTKLGIVTAGIHNGEFKSIAVAYTDDAFKHQAGLDIDHSRANAKLIAAAPSLLAEVHRLRSALSVSQEENERLREDAARLDWLTSYVQEHSDIENCSTAEIGWIDPDSVDDPTDEDVGFSFGTQVLRYPTVREAIDALRSSPAPHDGAATTTEKER